LASVIGKDTEYSMSSWPETSLKSSHCPEAYKN